MSSLKIDVLDKGHVILVDYYPKVGGGPELAIVNSARQSFGIRKNSLDEKDTGLINFLMREHHSTPFEAVDFTFHIKAPVFVAREHMRHRTFSYNELSQRYKEIPLEFYIPKPEHVRTQKGKPGAYTFVPIDGDREGVTRWAISEMDAMYKQAYLLYKNLIDAKIAKELARCVLPIGIYSEFICKGNLRNWLNFLSLRNHEAAQLEIREYAKAIEKIINKVCPITMKAWEEHGRKSV